MKTIFLFIFFTIVLIPPLKAQNLVPNPSFEFYNADLGDLTANHLLYLHDSSFNNTSLSCWADPLMNMNSNVLLSTDYRYFGYNIPLNHTARTGLNKGVIYLGSLLGSDPTDSIYSNHNYFQTRLTSPLTAGQAYTFTMYVSSPATQCFDSITSSLCQSSVTTVRNLGVSISATRPFNTSTSGYFSGRLYLTPELNFDGFSFVTDDHSWITLTSTYIATGGEQYLTIGNFDSYSGTVFEPPIIPPSYTSTIEAYAILLVDDVSLVPSGVTDTTASYLNIGNDTIICSSAPINITLTAQTGFNSYLWNTGATGKSITVTDSGTYYCTVGTTCMPYTDTIKIRRIADGSMNFSLGNDTSICTNLGFFSIPLSVPNTFISYLWSNGDTTSSINATSYNRTYWVVAKYACVTVSDTLVVGSLSSIYNLTLGNDTTICNGGSFFLPLAPTAGFSNYTWSTGAVTPDITINSAGTYWVIGDSTCGSVTDTITVSSQPYLSLNLGNDTSLCTADVPLVLSANPGFTTYTWNTSASTRDITAATSGTYYVTASYYCGTVSDTIGVTVLPTPPPPVTADTMVCVFSSVPPLHATGTNILWYTSSSGTGSTIPPPINTVSTGDVIVYATQTTNNCISTKASLTVNVINQPNFELGADQLICMDDQITLGPTNTSWNYLWNDSVTTSPRVVTTANKYILTATNQCGYAVDSIQLTLDDCNCYVYLPNAFTPNGDGLNDVFMPVTHCRFSTYLLKIFNRWGEIVFYTDDPKEGWNGSFNGLISPSDVYVIQINYKGERGIKKSLMDKVVLVR